MAGARMHPRSVFLVPTERHAEQALAEGHAAFTFAGFLERVTYGLAARPATRDVSALATAVALESVRGDAFRNDEGAFARALDATLGAMRRAGIDARALRRSNARRAQLLADLSERTDE